MQPVAGGANALVTDYLRRFSPDAPLFAAAFPQVPRCSTYYGGGGVAWFLYRLASVRESPELLSWAKSAGGKGACGYPGGRRRGFLHSSVMPAEVVGPLSLHHSESGIRLVQALVAQGRGDIPQWPARSRAGLRAGRRPAVAEPGPGLGSGGRSGGLYPALGGTSSERAVSCRRATRCAICWVGA